MPPYKLSASLVAHTSDVRSVASPSDDLVLSTSRDKKAISWIRSSPNNFKPDVAYEAGSKFVNAVAYIPPTSEAPRGYMVTGGLDKIVNIFALGSGISEPKYSLIGHRENVCALDASANGLIISGSWDNTARVWTDFSRSVELSGHSAPVWAVLIYDELQEQYLTASADKTIKLWNGTSELQTYSGHTSAVRGLAKLHGIGFASCSNDSEIRVWALDGTTLYTLSGHTSFVYSIAVLPNGDLVSSGEDRTVRVWSGDECIQTIVHPAISVWSVSTMPNGDIVSGASDKVVRIFSASEKRWAPAEDLKKYDDLIASQALPSQQVGDIKKNDLPGLEALAVPGRKAGEVKMIRNGDIVEAHQWDNASSNWQKIGDVVDAVGSGRKQLYEGKEYDYVFDVDIEDGAPPLKLPYNVNENPYHAAQRFLAANDLPMSYVDQVVQFIERNTAGVTLGQNTEFVDPFTGATRYQPTSSTSGPSTAGSDPFTGAGRYTPSVQPQAPSAGSDPLTGAGRYVPTSSSTQPAATPTPAAQGPKVIPVRTFLSFKQGNIAAMRGKIFQLDDAYRNEISTATIAMYPDETASVEEALAYLAQATSPSSNVTLSTLTSSHLETVVLILKRWDTSSRFPIIDLARLIIGYCPTSYSDPIKASQLFSSLFEASEWDEPWDAPIPKTKETNVLLTLRALANAFQESTPAGGAPWVAQVLAEIKKVPYEKFSKNHRVALATLLFNFSCVRLKGKVDPAVSSDHLSLIANVLTQEQKDAETAYRALVALGNTVLALTLNGGEVDVADLSRLQQAANSLQSRFPEDRIKAICQDIDALL